MIKQTEREKKLKKAVKKDIRDSCDGDLFIKQTNKKVMQYYGLYPIRKVISEIYTIEEIEKRNI